MPGLRFRRSTIEILAFVSPTANPNRGHVVAGSLSGALQVRKDIVPHLRSAHAEQKPAVDFKGKSRLDPILHTKGSGCESTA